MSADLNSLYLAVLSGDAKSAKEITSSAIASGNEPLKLVQDYMTPAMQEVGRRFERHDCFVPELLLAARAMKGALEIIRPLLAAKSESIASAGRVIIGTVKGDLHDIGKNLAAGMLEGAGYEVIDLGVNVLPELFVAAADAKKADVVAMSALLTTTMPAMKETVAALEQAGLRKQVTILIGGAPVSQEYAEEIGADGYCDSAAVAVRRLQEIKASLHETVQRTRNF